MDNERLVALYIRVSTDEQAEKGHSLKQQEEHLVAYAKAAGFLQYRLYQDDGYSAKSLQRPALQELLQDLEDGCLQGVITTKIDRLTRKNKDFSYLLDLFDRHGVFYKATGQNFEVGTASGKLLAQMLSVVAEFEREMIGERVYENLFRMAQKGLLATKPPFGYKLQGGRLMPDEQEAAWVRRCAELFLSGHGCYQVAKFLNDQQVRSPHGGHWSAGSVRTLFRNPVLTGVLRWNVHKGAGAARKQRDEAEWIVRPDSVPPILTDREFAAIQQQINRRAALSPRARSGARLLSGIAKCGFCGGPMHAGWQIYRTKAGKHKHPTYRCGNYASAGTCPYINRVNAEELDQAVIGQIMQFVTDRVDTSALLADLKGKIEHELRRIQQSLHMMDNRRQKLIEAYSLGILTPSELQAAKARLETEQAVKQRRLEELNQSLLEEEPETLRLKQQEKLAGLLTNLEGYPEARRAAVVALIEEVKVIRTHFRQPAEIEITFRL